MKKVLWYSPSPFSAGGHGKVTRELLKRLEGWKATVLSPMENWNEILSFGKQRHKLISCHNAGGVKYYAKLRDVDVIVVYGSLDWVNTYLRSPQTSGIPLMVYVTLEEEHQAERLLHQRVRTDKIIVPSRWNQEILEQKEISSEVLYHGVDLTKYKPASNPKSHKGFVFGYLMGFTPRKDPRLLLQTFKTLEFREKVRLFISGDTKQVNEYLPGDLRIDCCPYAKRGLILPESQLPQRYQSFDVHVYPTQGDSFGLSMIEAAACGIPQVVTDLPITHEILKDAAIFTALDMDALGKAMSSIYNDEPGRQILANKGLQRAKEFSWDASAKRLDTLLEEVIA